MKVLVPVDGSQKSLDTIQTASQFLSKECSDIYILTVMVPLASEIPWETKENLSDVDSLLNTARSEVEDLGFKVVKSEYTKFSDAASAICQYADDIEADLIVMGSHGHQSFTQFLMGSVSKKVFSSANQPVVIVRNSK
jgi:nucleotide-binding universal stress UspA family protein